MPILTRGLDNEALKAAQTEGKDTLIVERAGRQPGLDPARPSEDMEIAGVIHQIR